MKAERMLSPDILRKANCTEGGEYAWKREDIFNAIQDARRNNFAVIGGQVQFRFPKAFCDFYWLDYVSAPKLSEEHWSAYVERSANEVTEKLKMLLDTKDFIQEGIDGFGYIKEATKNSDIKLEDYLYFALYLTSFDETEVEISF